MNDAALFWAEMAPCEHLVQIYEEDEVFLRTLEGFVADGLAVNEAVIVVATPEHLAFLARTLSDRGIDLTAAVRSDQYVAVDANTALDLFMVNGWPDDELFNSFVGDLLSRATRGGRRVRAFGEMVAILWARGHCGSTVRLEHLWHALCEEQRFMLFCAYPRAGFTRNPVESIQEICETHSRVIA